MEGREERRQRGLDRGRREGRGSGDAQLRRKSSARTVRLPVSGCWVSGTSRNRTPPASMLPHRMHATHPNALGRPLRGFFADNLPRVRSLSHHTIRSSRDALKLLLLFLERHLWRPAETLDFPDLSCENLFAFQHHLETERGHCVATRNVRLAALHSTARYAAPLFP